MDGGKGLGGFAVGVVSLIIVIAALILLIGVWPAHCDEVIGFGLLTLIIFVAWGMLLATLFKNRTPVLALAFGISTPLFILSGAFGPLSFTTPAIQFIAQLFPVAYAIALQQHAFHNFNLNTYGIGGNALVLVGYALALIILAAVALRRSTVAHLKGKESYYGSVDQLFAHSLYFSQEKYALLASSAGQPSSDIHFYSP